MNGGTDSNRRGVDAAIGAASLEASGTVAGPARLAVRRLESGSLLAGAREVEIDHHGELYRLRCTNKGKLILTK